MKKYAFYILLGLAACSAPSETDPSTTEQPEKEDTLTIVPSETDTVTVLLQSDIIIDHRFLWWLHYFFHICPGTTLLFKNRGLYQLRRLYPFKYCNWNPCSCLRILVFQALSFILIC